jgi:hypothetical protein
MCEPHHSIVQYPNDDDQSGSSNQTRLQMGLKKLYDFGRKVGRWFHLSRMGSGHSESMLWAKTNSVILPENINYEGVWWERKFQLDMPFFGRPRNTELIGTEAFDAAKTYHERVVFQNIQSFRRFLEESIRSSERAAALYVERLRDHVLNPQGVQQLDQRFGTLAGRSRFDIKKLLSACKEQAIKCVMGITRKREWFRSHFSDDDGLWLPKKEGIIFPA